jgi:hypothetical protein
MGMRNRNKRLELIEKQLISEPIVLLMPDGRTEMLPGHNDYVLNAWVRGPWRPDAGDGTDRPEPKLYRAGRRSHDRPGAGAVERTSRGWRAGSEPGVRNLVRRLQKLEGRLTDATGLVPHSEAWFAYYKDQFARWEVGEEFRCIPLAVIDRITEDADRGEKARTG